MQTSYDLRIRNRPGTEEKNVHRTPLVKLRCAEEEGCFADVYAKLEYQNPGGSVRSFPHSTCRIRLYPSAPRPQTPRDVHGWGCSAAEGRTARSPRTASRSP
jgi:hypothetical protein